MQTTVRERLRALTGRQAVMAGVALGAFIEAITAAMRFGGGLQSTRDTAWMARYTFGLRIHHGYIGAVLLVLAVLSKVGAARNFLLILGIALLLSDLAHHFLVLWPITGSPQFDLLYSTAVK